MKDFWLSCGHHLTDRDGGGGLVATDAFLKAYLARPELAPPPEACAAERALHASLLAAPHRPVAASEIAAIQDADARENWQLMLAFRDHLLSHKTLEAAYLHLVRSGVGRTPPLFLNQLVHVILRNLLDGSEDPLELRAAELFFRTQRVTLHQGSLIAADDETIEGMGQDMGQDIRTTLNTPLVAMLGLGAEAAIDVIGAENAAEYWERSDRFDMALDLTSGHQGLAALAAVMARWIRHMLDLEVTVEPVPELRDARLTWYVGLDSEGTRIGDALWHGETLEEERAGRVAGLFRLSGAALDEDATKGEPVYLILAVGEDRKLRLKPQNLLTGLPVRQGTALT